MTDDDERTRPASRRKDIQGLRAVAVLLVVAFHAGLPLPGGYVGVDVFFVISGFVIAAMLLRELDRGEGLGFASFYARRMRRLLPALALLSTFVAVAGTVLLSPLGPQQATARTGIAASLFAANIQLSQVDGGGYFDQSTDTNAMLHTWSLSIEEQFYLVLPAVLLLLFWASVRWPVLGSRRRTLGALLSLAALGSFAVSVVTTYRPSERLSTTFAFYMAPARAWEFLAGVLLALAAPRMARLGRVPAVAAGVIGVVLLAYASLAFDGATKFPGYLALIPVAGALLLIVAGAPAAAGAPGASRLLATRPAVFVGDVSYGWYLWHWPFIVFAAAMWPGRTWILVVAAVASLGPALLSYRFYENPIRFDERLVGRRVVPLVAACIIVPILACAGLLAVNRTLLRTDRIRDFEEATALHEDRVRGCDTELALGERDLEPCTWPVDDPQGTVVLVGDSNAGHFTEPVTRAANGAGYDAVVATSAGCPFVDLIRRETATGTFDGTRCHDAVEDSVDELIATSPSLVVIAASATEYVNDGSERLSDPETGAEAGDPAGKARLWEQGTRSVVERLDAAGIPVAVVHPIPQFGTTLGESWHADTCATLRIWTDSCGGSRSRSGVEAEQALVVEAEDQAVEGLDLAATVDTDPLLCTERTCATSRGDILTYRDASHISIAGAALLDGLFAGVVEDQARPSPS